MILGFTSPAKGAEQGTFMLVGGAAMRAEVRAREVALGARILAVIEVAVDPFEIEQLDQRLAHAAVGEPKY